MRIESNLPSRSPAADAVQQQAAQRAASRKKAASAHEAPSAQDAPASETNEAQSAAPSEPSVGVSVTAAIPDADAAAQAVQFASNSIVSQPASALLAQASLLPQGALRLLV